MFVYILILCMNILCPKFLSYFWLEKGKKSNWFVMGYRSMVSIGLQAIMVSFNN